MLYQQTIQAPLPVQSFLSNSCIQSQREEPAEILPARDSGALDDTHAHTCAWIIWSICWTSVNNQIVDGLNIVICCAVLCCLHNIYSHVTVFIEKSSFQWVRKKKRAWMQKMTCPYFSWRVMLKLKFKLPSLSYCYFSADDLWSGWSSEPTTICWAFSVRPTYSFC